jgi:hypothetical protein
MANSPNSVVQIVRDVAPKIGATEAAAFGVDGVQRITTLLHLRPGTADITTRRAAVAAFRDILIPCVQVGKDGAIEIEGTNDAFGKQFCLVTLWRRAGIIMDMATFIVRCRDKDEARAALTRVRNLAWGV